MGLTRIAYLFVALAQAATVSARVAHGSGLQVSLVTLNHNTYRGWDALTVVLRQILHSLACSGHHTLLWITQTQSVELHRQCLAHAGGIRDGTLSLIPTRKSFCQGATPGLGGAQVLPASQPGFSR